LLSVVVTPAMSAEEMRVPTVRPCAHIRAWTSYVVSLGSHKHYNYQTVG
jgi:hypothetical protein